MTSTAERPQPVSATCLQPGPQWKLIAHRLRWNIRDQSPSEFTRTSSRTENFYIDPKALQIRRTPEYSPLPNVTSAN